MAGESELRISGDEFPPTSVRGVTETLKPIDNPQFDKYSLSIQCSDKNAPPFDGLREGNWRRTVNGGLVDLSGNGSVVSIDAISELAYRTGGSPAATPRRTPVSGSSRTDGDFTFYRPHFPAMGLISMSMDTDEYGAVVKWQAVFEEI